jgi:uncharacterized protein YprB with RNaseH-like and TPR domain
MKRRAYIDIETTGLSRKFSELTVIGIAIEEGSNLKVIQLMNKQLSNRILCRSLKGVNELYSYNGVDLKERFKHTDLMYDCWHQSLKGGLKAVEKKLGIKRRLKNVDGWMAVQLWNDYINNHNEESLVTLLEYNKEDVVNLRVLRRILKIK